MRFIAIIFILLFIGCKESRERRSSEQKSVEEQLIEMNRNLHQAEKKRLATYVAENAWPVQESETGMYIWRYEEGEGPQAEIGQIATIQYSSELLDGTPCYSTEVAEPLQFRVGEDHVITGLHQAIVELKVGDKAKILVPSHLAFGLTGDQDKVPPNSSLLYELELLAVQ